MFQTCRRRSRISSAGVPLPGQSPLDPEDVVSALAAELEGHVVARGEPCDDELGLLQIQASALHPRKDVRLDRPRVSHKKHHVVRHVWPVHVLQEMQESYRVFKC